MPRIQSVSIASCCVPLPRPVRLGKSEIRTRDFVALRIETDAGLAGEAIGYVRGTPLFAAIETMAQRAIGAEALMRRELIHGIESSNLPGRAALTRASSLLDIALWDIAAKHARLPLFQMIGGLEDSADVTAVAGYYMDARPTDDIVAEVARRLDEGFARVKIMLDGNHALRDRQLLTATASLPGRIAVDAHWSWSTLTEARRYWLALDSLGLDFLEDPFAASDWRLTHELQATIRTPIAAGEDVCGAAQMDQLVRGINLLRIDATTCGGITGAIEAINIAAAAGRTVLPHVFAPLHVQLACAFPNVEGVEIIPEDVGADPIHVLLKQGPKCSQGKLRPSVEPGVGLVLDWAAIERCAVQTRRIEAER